MKSTIISLLTTLLCIHVFAQNTKYQYEGRFAPTVKKEKLQKAVFLGDISSELWEHISLPAKEYYEFNKRCKTEGYYNYHTIIDYVSVDISTIRNNKRITARSTSNRLTPEQKEILNAVDFGADIDIEISFKYKIDLDDTVTDIIRKGKVTVIALPAYEAEFIDNKDFAGYITERVISVIKQTDAGEKVRQAIVKFTVDENGNIVNAGIFETSTDKRVDTLLLDIIRGMPKWKSAKNEKGIKVKQQFKIPFGSGGC